MSMTSMSTRHRCSHRPSPTQCSRTVGRHRTCPASTIPTWPPATCRCKSLSNIRLSASRASRAARSPCKTSPLTFLPIYFRWNLRVMRDRRSLRANTLFRDLCHSPALCRNRRCSAHMTRHLTRALILAPTTVVTCASTRRQSCKSTREKATGRHHLRRHRRQIWHCETRKPAHTDAIEPTQSPASRVTRYSLGLTI